MERLYRGGRLDVNQCIVRLPSPAYLAMLGDIHRPLFFPLTDRICMREEMKSSLIVQAMTLIMSCFFFANQLPQVVTVRIKATRPSLQLQMYSPPSTDMIT